MREHTVALCCFLNGLLPLVGTVPARKPLLERRASAEHGLNSGPLFRRKPSAGPAPLKAAPGPGQTRQKRILPPPPRTGCAIRRVQPSPETPAHRILARCRFFPVAVCHKVRIPRCKREPEKRYSNLATAICNRQSNRTMRNDR